MNIKYFPTLTTIIFSAGINLFATPTQAFQLLQYSSVEPNLQAERRKPIPPNCGSPSDRVGAGSRAKGLPIRKLVLID